jgi:hypothetical protein
VESSRKGPVHNQNNDEGCLNLHQHVIKRCNGWKRDLLDRNDFRAPKE